MSVKQAQCIVNQIDKDIVDLDKKMIDLVKKKEVEKQRELDKYNLVLQKARHQVYINQKYYKLKICKRQFPRYFLLKQVSIKSWQIKKRE